MSSESEPQFRGRMGSAVAELEDIVRRRYPDALFRIARSQDDPAGVHVVATVDVDDTEEVVDAVIDRMMELQIEDELPIFVIPVRPSHRVAAILRQGGGAPHVGRPFPSLERRNLPGS